MTQLIDVEQTQQQVCATTMSSSPADTAIVFSPESLLCASTDRNRILASSQNAGWTSLLVQHLEGHGRTDPYDRTSTSDLVVVVATGGEHQIEVFKRGRWTSAVVQPGAVSVSRPEESCRLQWHSRLPNRPFTTAHLYLPRRFLIEGGERFRRAGQKSFEHLNSSLILHDQAVASTTVALLHAMRSGVGDMYAEQAGRWLATHLLWAHGEFRDAVEDGGGSEMISDVRLARVIDYIFANYGQALSIGKLANVALVSPFHFSKLFRTATGRTPIRFVTDVRLRAARRLLQTTDLSVAAIAVEYGYTSTTAFSAAFTRYVGCSPSRCRARGGRASRRPG